MLATSLLHFSYLASIGCASGKAHVLFGACKGGLGRFEFVLGLLDGRIAQTLVIKHRLAGLDRLVTRKVCLLTGDFGSYGHACPTAGAVNFCQRRGLVVLCSRHFCLFLHRCLSGLHHLCQRGGALGSQGWLVENLRVTEAPKVIVERSGFGIGALTRRFS